MGVCQNEGPRENKCNTHARGQREAEKVGMIEKEEGTTEKEMRRKRTLVTILVKGLIFYPALCL